MKKSNKKTVSDAFMMFGDIDFAQPPTSLSIYNIESLESNRLFRALKTELERFYIEKNRPVERQTLHKTKTTEWKDRFYQSLQTLLNEVLFTTSSRLKQALLEKIQKWYFERTGVLPIPEHRRISQSRFDGPIEPEIYILQNIESTRPTIANKAPPYLPNKIVIDKEEYSSKRSLFKELLENEKDDSFINLPKVKNLRTKENFYRPYSPIKDQYIQRSPVIMDFRSTNRAQSTGFSRNQSPCTLRRTSFVSYIGSEMSPTNENSTVPELRRFQIKEVMKIKKRLASKGILCPVKVLEGGLVISDFSMDPVQFKDFPRGGELLMKDPNDPKKSLKKKRKKGKKKA